MLLKSIGDIYTAPYFISLLVLFFALFANSI